MVRWLVAGIGDIVHKRVLAAILAEPRSELAGFLTRDPTKALPYGVPAWTDLHRALDESGAHAVYIATPVFLHAPQTIAALKAGKHVLCEKPMALNYAAAGEMQRVAVENGKLLGVAYYRRLYPKLARARELMEQGAIGRPVIVEATAHDWFDAASGFRAWLTDPTMAGGGPLRDVASHRIDTMNYLFGRPARVCGQASTIVQPVAVEDNVTLLIEYENGVRGVVDARWHSHIPRDEFRIRGTEGELDLTPLNGAALVNPRGTEQAPPHANLHYPCVENFVSAVLDGTSLVSSGATALVTEWVMEQVSAPGER